MNGVSQPVKVERAGEYEHRATGTDELPVKDALLIINMGGPASLDQVPAYLTAIFNDPAILPVPDFMRGALAKFITSRRTVAVCDRYKLIGGHSPLHYWTERLRRNMESSLRQSGCAWPVAFAFRYSAPLIESVMAEFKRDGIEHVHVVPLFPHYTHAMTGSVLIEVERAAAANGIHWDAIRRWGHREEVNQVWRKYLEKSLDIAGDGARVMFVAHGIPMRNVRKGDTYPAEVEATAKALAATLPGDVEWTLAYQSKVGPVAWTGPYMEDELARLVKSPAPLIIMPLSFVADCLETLYDLDHVALEFARKAGVENIVRVRVFNDDPAFASVLADLVREEYRVS